MLQVVHSGPYTNLPNPSHHLSSLQFFIPIVIIFIPPYPYFVPIMQIPHHPSDSPSSYLYHFPYAWKSFTWSPSSHYFFSFRTSYPYHYIPSYFQSHHNCQAHHFPISHAHLAHHHTHLPSSSYPFSKPIKPIPCSSPSSINISHTYFLSLNPPMHATTLLIPINPLLMADTPLITFYHSSILPLSAHLLW